MRYSRKQSHAQDQEMTELASFDVKETLPDWDWLGLVPIPKMGEIKKGSEEMREIMKDLEKYRGGGRFESKDGLKNHFEVKRW